MNNKKTMIYLRVSSEQQSYEHQMESIDKYCKSNNIIYDKVFADYGISAYSTEISQRKALMELLALSSENSIDRIICFESSRLSRNNLQMQFIISQFTTNGVTIISVTEGILNGNSEINELLNAIRGFNAQSESKKLSQRTKSAKELMKKQGKHLGGVPLWGYKVTDRGTFEIDTNIAPIIKGLFEFYCNNGSKKTIEYLALYGKKINYPTQLFYYLKNPMYKGMLYGQYYEHLQIVSTELFDRVQNIIKARTTNANRTSVTDRTPYLCESIVYCTSCGLKMFINTSKNSNSYSYRKRCKCIGQKNFSIRKVDKLVDYEIKQYLDTLDIQELKNRFEMVRSTEYNKLLVQEKQLNIVLATKKQTFTNAKNKLNIALEQDYPLSLIQNITDSMEQLKLEINSLELQIQNITNEIDNEQLAIEKHNSLIEKMLSFTYLYTNANQTEKKLISRELIDKILIGSNFNEIQIQWKY